MYNICMKIKKKKKKKNRNKKQKKKQKKKTVDQQALCVWFNPLKAVTSQLQLREFYLFSFFFSEKIRLTIYVSHEMSSLIFSKNKHQF